MTDNLRRTIALLGCPVLNEDGAASEAITPGHLVKGVTSIAKQTATTGDLSRTFALERDEMGKGISTAYAIGDYVKVGAFHAGCHVYAIIASGQNIAADQYLESAGNGTLRAIASGARLGRALEAVNNSAGPGDARLRVEIV